VTTWRLMDGASGRPGVGSSGTQPPATGSSYSGDYCAGLVFSVDQGSLWFEGYWWWVPLLVSQTTAQEFALWQLATDSGTPTGALVAGSAVTSGTLTAGAFNFVPLAVPLLLAANIPYVAVTGYVSTAGFPLTQNQFGSGGPYASGITNGPLTAYASQGTPIGDMPQQPFSVAGADPSLTFPNNNDANDLLWIDVQATDAAPASPSYRAWPNMPVNWPPILNTGDTTGYTLGMEFELSESCTLEKIWHYSAPGVSALPTRCCIWAIATQTEVSGTDNSSPSWLLPGGGAASAGNGWCYVDYSGSGVTLLASTGYKVSTFHAAGTTWFGATANVYGTGDLQAAGFTQGPLTVPGQAAATSPGQQTWDTNAFGYPATSSNPEADWIDVEVTPAGGTGHTAAAALTVTPSFAAAAAHGQHRTGALTVTPSFSAAPSKGGVARTRTAALVVTPSFSAAHVQAHVRSAALTVTPRFSAAASGGAARAGASAALFEDERSGLSKLRMLGGWTA
jgi:hypothetical protein